MSVLFPGPQLPQPAHDYCVLCLVDVPIHNCCMHSLLVPCIVLCPTVAGRSSRAAAMISCAMEVQFRQTCVWICILLLDFDVFVVSARKELAGAVVVFLVFGCFCYYQVVASLLKYCNQFAMDTVFS